MRILVDAFAFRSEKAILGGVIMLLRYHEVVRHQYALTFLDIKVLRTEDAQRRISLLYVILRTTYAISYFIT